MIKIIVLCVFIYSLNARSQSLIIDSIFNFEYTTDGSNYNAYALCLSHTDTVFNVIHPILIYDSISDKINYISTAFCSSIGIPLSQLRRVLYQYTNQTIDGSQRFIIEYVDSKGILQKPLIIPRSVVESPQIDTFNVFLKKHIPNCIKK